MLYTSPYHALFRDVRSPFTYGHKASSVRLSRFGAQCQPSQVCSPSDFADEVLAIINMVHTDTFVHSPAVTERDGVQDGVDEQ